MDRKKVRVAVIGGGIAGLHSAYRLSRENMAVDLYEAAPFWGGLGSSFDFDGLQIERFYHFICRNDHALLSLAEELDIREQIEWFSSRTGQYVHERFYNFSSPWDLLLFKEISLCSRVRFAAHALYCQRLKNWDSLEEQTAEEWLVRWIGRKAYDLVWKPLLKIKFGNNAPQISASWIWHRIHRVATSRKSIFANEEFGCFKGGSQTLIDALVVALEKESTCSLFLKTQVQELEEREEGGFCLRTGTEEERRYDRVVSTLPLPLLAKLLKTKSADWVSRLNDFSYLGVVCMILKMSRKISPYYWLNINDREISFNGIIEYSNLKPCAQSDQHVAYIPYYLDVNEARFGLSDEELFKEYLKALQKICPGFSEKDILSYRVFREKYAQAVCGTHFGQKRLGYKSFGNGLYVSDSTQLYPEDRSLSGMIDVSGRAFASLMESV